MMVDDAGEKTPKTETTQFETLPTGKPHVSFSELKDWRDCSWRHKLKHVHKIDLEEPGVHMDFGTACHAACESFLKTRVMDASIASAMLDASWQANAGREAFDADSLVAFKTEAASILADVPEWFDETFPGWTFIDAEHQLYERIEGTNHAFKGFIDGIISVPGKGGKTQYWLLDWKTCGWGWSVQKKSDPLVRAQLIFYKNFWSKKAGIDPRVVRCGFVLLKRTAKPGAHCELVTASVGPTTTARSLKIVTSMLKSVKRGSAVKNRLSCTYCKFKNTEHCT